MKGILLIILVLVFARDILAQTFSTAPSVTILSMANPGCVWADFDSDGDLDLAITGSTNISYPFVVEFHLYENINGDSLVEIPSAIEGTIYGAIKTGDFNNDSKPDIAICGLTNNLVEISKIYLNQGSFAFSELTTTNLMPVVYGEIDLSDFNNDGWVDILLNGSHQDGSVVSQHTIIYKNNGDGTFDALLNTNLPNLIEGKAKWIDYNSDDKMDVFMVGKVKIGTTLVDTVYLFRNDGNLSFSKLTGLPFSIYYTAGYSWGDFNNDGYPDLALCGYKSPYTYADIYRNNNGTSFTKLTGLSLAGMRHASVFWGDTDNDGNLDLLLSGNSAAFGTTPITRLYHNNGSGSFPLVSSAGLANVYGVNNMCDFDNDGDMDVFLSGQSGSSAFSRLYINNSTINNLPPQTPILGNCSSDYQIISIPVIPSSDDITPVIALTYNIQAVSSANSILMSSLSNYVSGYRRVVSAGNVGLLTDTFHINNVPPGEYYISIQAVDNSFKGSTFSVVDTVVVQNQMPNIQAYDINYSVNNYSITLNWSIGSGNARAVFISQASSGSATPIDLFTYIPSDTFGIGSQIGSSGWCCVFNGNGTTANVHGLNTGTDYRIMVCEYSGTSGTELFNSSVTTGNPITVSTSGLNNLINNGISCQISGSKEFADFNNDGLLDIIQIGQQSSPVICYNNGDSTFTPDTLLFLPEIQYSSVAIADYNNDGTIDFIAAGENSTTNLPYTKLCRNNGNGTFSIDSLSDIINVLHPAMDWGDINNDGYLDLLICGEISDRYITYIYLNYLEDGFSRFDRANLIGISQGVGRLVDLNNDGYKDVFLSGLTTPYISGAGIGDTVIVYINDSASGFHAISTPSLKGNYISCVDFGDVNNDGYYDILHSGTYAFYGNVKPEIFINNINSFTPLPGTNFPVDSGSECNFIDYNSDGFLDVFLSFRTSSTNNKSTIFKNTGLGNFDRQLQYQLRGSLENTAHKLWGDFNNDNKPDLFISPYLTRDSNCIYYNDYPYNNPPSIPAGLTSSISGQSVNLSWAPSTDDHTPTSSLSYNVVLYSADGAMVLSPLSDTSTGKRKVVGEGNAALSNTLFVQRLNSGKYIWKIQAIDQGYSASAFSMQDTFLIPQNPPLVQANNIVFTSIYDTIVSFKWEKGSSGKSAVFVSENVQSFIAPDDSTTYTANTIFGMGSQISGSGYYCVYNGKSDFVSISGLNANSVYTIQVCEYSGNSGTELFNTDSAFHNPDTVATSPFKEQSSILLQPSQYGLSKWGDVNNDGFLDIFSLIDTTQSTRSRAIFINNGNNSFSISSNKLEELKNYSDFDWGDKDNDNDLDFIYYGPNSLHDYSIHLNENGLFNEDSANFHSTTLCNTAAVKWADFNNDGKSDVVISKTGSPSFTRIYKNDGIDTLALVVDTLLQNHLCSSIECFDFNNDNWTDIMLVGVDTASNNIPMIYFNYGNWTFIETTPFSIPPLSNLKMFPADYNNDTYIDFALIGRDTLGQIFSRIYKNDGNGTFDYVPGTTDIPVWQGSGDWGDFDSDGDLDLLICGQTGQWWGYSQTALILRNDGNDHFSKLYFNNIPPIIFGSVDWGDYDNDGDLDILISGFAENEGDFVKILRNETNTYVTPISPPTVSSANSIGNTVSFSWMSSKANSNISYNLAVSIDTSNCSIVSPLADLNTGSLFVPELGNMGYSTNYLLQNLSPGYYYWKIQSVDSKYRGSLFSPFRSFVIIKCHTDTSVCIENPVWIINGCAPAGGTYSGNGVSGGIFNPTIAGVGAHNIKYKITTGTISDSCNFTITVLPEPSVSLLIPFDSACYQTNPPYPNYPLSGGLPSGGYFSGTHIEDSLLLIGSGTTGTGYSVIYYCYTDANGCSGTDADSVYLYDCSTGIIVSNGNSIAIYPNPASDKIIITHDINIEFLEIVSIEGKSIWSTAVNPGNSTTIADITALEQGPYFLRWRSNDTFGVISFVKE